MKRISFNHQFVNEAGNDLIPGKIHTIRQNYDYWKKFEGKEVALFVWEGKPYRSKQKVFCVKRIASVQEIYLYKDVRRDSYFYKSKQSTKSMNRSILSKNDGFEKEYEFNWWFQDKIYKAGKMAIIHFTDFRY